MSRSVSSPQRANTGSVALCSTATRFNPGTASRSSCTRLAASCSPKLDTPVTRPPGRDRLVNRSVWPPRGCNATLTTGTASVARRISRTAAAPGAKYTATAAVPASRSIDSAAAKLPAA